ncbi:hypothetical protein [Marinobacter adhaerens]|jgi:hypothetical protein|uniref:hypothetical protein n=2 Tax=Marinobacter adhaerens TaxID=1033846 RepID=UPI000C9821C4|nr:hypothetical protein [Marinobacter adhaerens]MAI30348.1 hypothetical protein [Rhodopirellula sp.]MBW3227242.1 hypothetical protein [Marinobacter adhaerens]
MSKLAGMTINERLFHVGIMDEFDASILSRDQEGAVALLQRVELSKEEAMATVATIFKDWGKYGYTKP